jgi:GT2 family glycosyltransferase
MVFIPDTSVAILILNWNGLDFSRSCLESLRKVDFPDFKVILVDNASQNEEGKTLKQLFPEIELLQNSENLGFAGGNNVGIKYALEQGYTHLMLLNNDTVVEPDFLGEMLLKFRQNPNLGVVQPLILFLHDQKIIWSAGGKWVPTLGRAITLGDRAPVSDYRHKKATLDWATGCCMLITREAILKAGLLNEQYFVYFEDVEWSLRFKNAGYDISLAERAIIYHEAGASSKKTHSEGTLTHKVFYFHVRNQFLLLREQKNHLAQVYHLIRFVAWMGYFLFRGRFKKLQSVAKGIKDGLSQPLINPPRWP